MNFDRLRKNILLLMQFRDKIASNEFLKKYLDCDDEEALKYTQGNIRVAILNEVENIIKEFLRNDPDNIDALFLLAMIELKFNDELQAIAIMKQILNFDPANYQALLILAFEEHLLRGVLDDETFEKLQHFQVDNPETQSLIELAKSWYYFGKDDDDMYEKSLKKSIELSSKFAWNYIALGNLYIRQGMAELGNNLIEQGNKNKVIKKEYDAGSQLSHEELIEDRIKGIIDYK